MSPVPNIVTACAGIGSSLRPTTRHRSRPGRPHSRCRPVGIENSDPQGCVLPAWAQSSNSSSSSGDSPVSTTTVWSSKEHHSSNILSDRSCGHSAGSVYHPFQLSFEELLVMTGKPPAKLVFIFNLYQVHGVLLVDLGQGEDVRRGGGIGAIDPINEGLVTWLAIADESVSRAGPMRGHGQPQRPSSDPEKGL